MDKKAMQPQGGRGSRRPAAPWVARVAPGWTDGPDALCAWAYMEAQLEPYTANPALPGHWTYVGDVWGAVSAG